MDDVIVSLEWVDSQGENNAGEVLFSRLDF